MNNFYLSQLLFNTPLAISERKLHTILEVLGPRLQGDVRALSATHDPMPLGREEETHPDGPGIAIIPVMGSLMHRTFGMQAFSGLTSYQSIQSMVASAIGNEAVQGIVLDIDSPGGEVNGLFDLADFIHAASKLKPIMAMVDEFSLSAAYGIASGASSIVMPRTGAAGSIGVLALHVDQSQMDKQDGLKFTFIKAGALKDEGNSHAPLGNEARARIQAEVDRVYGLFVATAARHRGIAEEAVRAMEAGVFFGSEAVEEGLVDRIASRGEAIQEFVDQIHSQSTSSVGYEPTGATPAFAGLSDTKENTMSKATIVPTHTPSATGAVPPPAESAAAAAVVQSHAPAINSGATTQEQIKQMATSYLAEVTELCQLSGKPEKAAEFIKAGLNSEQIRAALLEARAREDEALAIATQAPTAPQTQASSQTMEPASEIYARMDRELTVKR